MNWKNPFFLLLSLLMIACSPLAPTSYAAADPTIVPSKQPVIPPEPETVAPTSPNDTAPETATATTALLATSTVFLPTIQAPVPTVPPASSRIVADHTVIENFDRIPDDVIQAASKTRAVMFHQSTGQYISGLGLDCLAGLRREPENYPDCMAYLPSDGYDRSNWHWTLEEEWITNGDSLKKVEVFKQLVPQYQADVDVIGMKYCYIDGWAITFEPYRAAMEEMEAKYPTKTFIWATSAVWGSPGSACGGDWNSCQTLYEFNQKVREYAAAHNKPLFDIASIESNGGQCKVAGYEGVCQEYYSDGGGHPNQKGSLRIAKGYWWLMARLTGWNGQP